MIEYATARRYAIDRVVRVLREEYCNVLKEQADAAGLQRQPAPLPRHIARVAALDVEDVVMNASVWVGVVPATGLTPSRAPGSRTGMTICQFMEFDVRCDLVFGEVAQELPTLYDRPDGGTATPIERRQLHAELMTLRADVYASALGETLLRYAEEADAITKIEVVTDEGFPLLSDEGRLFGSSTFVARLTLKVGLPAPRPLPSDT